MDTKTKNIIITSLVVIFAIFLVYIMYFYNKTDNSPYIDNEIIEEEIEQPISNAPDTSPEPLSMIQVYFNETIEIQPQEPKSQVAHTIILPIFKNIFDTTQQDLPIVGVKLKSFTNDSQLIYVFNRECTDSDIETFKNLATNIGARILKNTNPISLEYGQMNFTFNFFTNDQQKSGVEVNF